jgi:hypothetical protein
MHFFMTGSLGQA